MDSPLDADGKDRNDIGMIELRGGLGLMFEAGDLPAVEHRRERQDLQGDPPAQRDLLGLVDDAHAAPADFPQETKIAQPPLVAGGWSKPRSGHRADGGWNPAAISCKSSRLSK